MFEKFFSVVRASYFLDISFPSTFLVSCFYFLLNDFKLSLIFPKDLTQYRETGTEKL